MKDIRALQRVLKVRDQDKFSKTKEIDANDRLKPRKYDHRQSWVRFPVKVYFEGFGTLKAFGLQGRTVPLLKALYEPQDQEYSSILKACFSTSEYNYFTS